MVLYQVRERQITRIAVIRVTTHHQRESTYLARPQQITVTRRLGTAFGYALMYRAEFVHVVALVATRTCIQEREHTSYQQCRFMVSHRVRTGKDSARLAVHSLTVTEE